MRPARPERTRIQGKITTRRGRPEYPECARIHDIQDTGPSVVNARAFRIILTTG